MKGNDIVFEREMDQPEDWEDVEMVRDENGNIIELKGE